ncbi:MAG: hypothetical protein ICV66_08365, partial [Chitinophagaceae bacterium]|nr:hypothetical protein [Chitinophagaceae bacterium]
MALQKRNGNIKFAFVASVALISLNFWSFQGVSKSTHKVLEAAACLSIIATVLFNLNVLKRRELKFKVIALLLLFIPFLSAIGANLFHDQSLRLSLWSLRLVSFWLFYFVLHILQVSPSKIVRLLVFTGCVWAFLTIVQQFTYPTYYFYSSDESDAGFMRSDIFRFMIHGFEYGIFVLMYFFNKFLNTRKPYTLLFVLFALAGLYYMGTRQFTAAAVICMLVAVLIQKGYSKWVQLLFFSIAAFLFVTVFTPTLITYYINKTNEQVADQEYVRYLALNFYLNDYWPHWTATLIGNGPAHELSDYGTEMYT